MHGTPQTRDRSDRSDSLEASNDLLSALPETLRAQWDAGIEHVELSAGDVLYRSADPIGQVYFPTTSIVSMLYVTEAGATAELAVVGREGVVGVSLLLDVRFGPGQAVVQSAGGALRMRGQTLREAFLSDAEVRAHLLRYMRALMIQLSQNGVCNRHHSLRQQVCRWLLMSLDRVDGERLKMTHELIATMLGVRREGVTEAAQSLQECGAISYARGVIDVLDRDQLERLSCECYAVVADEYRRLGVPSRLSER